MSLSYPPGPPPTELRFTIGSEQMSESHNIGYHSDGGTYCTCGLSWPVTEPWSALRHAAPLNTAQLSADVAADPESSPELIERARVLAANWADQAPR